ncbi:hypothetical protein SESBI_33987 [Sesbania bispinosa]|nr:hypothetical protein SESBI_33987 [Sesbania bispinosa]
MNSLHTYKKKRTSFFRPRRTSGQPCASMVAARSSHASTVFVASKCRATLPLVFPDASLSDSPPLQQRCCPRGETRSRPILRSHHCSYDPHHLQSYLSPKQPHRQALTTDPPLSPSASPSPFSS